MKYFLACLFCLALSPVAMADDWVVLKKHADGSKIEYVDRVKTNSANGLGKAWVLTDYSARQTLKKNVFYKSDVVLSLFDCKNKRHGIALMTLFSGTHMGGEVIDSIKFKPDEIEWGNVTPGSTSDVLMKMACSNVKK